MTTRDDHIRHRRSVSNPRPSSVSSHSPQQLGYSHVPRFTLIHDLASGNRTYAPVKYLFADETQPSFTVNEGKTRTLVIDLAEDGERVVHAQSLSGEWQLISAKIGTSARPANVDGGETCPGNTVLNIEGLGQFTPFTKSDDVFDLARQFSERCCRLVLC